jgi:hypothetical protein
LAATPPPIARRSRPVCSRPRSTRAASASTIACWKEAARSARRSSAPVAQVAHLVEQRGLQPGEREVQAGDALAGREGEGLRVALAGELLERRTAGERQAEQPRTLVERLSGGVVERLAQDGEAVAVLDAREEGVPAAGHQAQERRGERLRCAVLAGPQEVRRHVALQVVDRDERQPARGGDPLGGRHPDEQRADEARALRDRHRVDVAELGAGPRQRVVDRRAGQLEVVAAGDLGTTPP